MDKQDLPSATVGTIMWLLLNNNNKGKLVTIVIGRIYVPRYLGLGRGHSLKKLADFDLNLSYLLTSHQAGIGILGFAWLGPVYPACLGNA
jgi:hypothetical protein